MDDLRALYNHIENPIDNKFKWNNILNIYSYSLDYNDFYENITKKNKSENCYYSKDDKEKYLLMFWSLFKKVVLSYDEETIASRVDNKLFDSDFYDLFGLLNSTSSIKEYKELEELLKNNLINKYYRLLFNEVNHNIVITSNFDLIRDYNYNIVFTITVGHENLYNFLIEYSNKCFENELPIYLKFNECGKYNNINIYSNIDTVKKTENIISILLKENSIFSYDNYYNLLSGDINSLLTIKNRNYYNENDYYNSRCMILFKSFDSVVFNYVVNHLNIIVSYKSGRMNLLDYISNMVTDKVVAELVRKSVKTESDYASIVNSKDLGKFREYINDKVYNTLDEVLKEKLYLKDGEDQIILKLSEKKSLNVDVSIYMYAIRSLTPTLLLKDNSIEKSFRIRIKNECGYVKVDPDKFCLDLSLTKKIMFDEKKLSTYENKITNIKNDINRLNDLEKLFNNDDSDDNRKKISTSMQELMSMFED